MPTVLVVDDSEVDRRLISRLLENTTDWNVEVARDGVEALSHIQQSSIDVVLTDLQMPEMDGLNLVQAVRVQYADLPVILMTGQGSESLAIEALQYGAAGYVPKSRVADILPQTLQDVWDTVGADRSFESLIDCLLRDEFEFELYNDPQLIAPLVDLVQQMAFGVGLCDAIDRVRVGIAVGHALSNAMLRGNLEIPSSITARKMKDIVQQRVAEQPYCDRRIHVDARITRDETKIVVRDQGPGFDVSTIPAAGDPGALEREGGRGLVLMRTFMDDIIFNGAGNEVTMIKRRNDRGSS